MPAIRSAASKLFHPVPWVTGAVWCVAALSLAYWFWLFPFAPEVLPAVAMTSPAESPLASAGPLNRVLGAVALEATPFEADRMQLVGVVSGPSGQGSALIAIDGQAPKPFRVGQALVDGWVLQGLESRKAHLGASVNGPKQRTLQLPALQTP